MAESFLQNSAVIPRKFHKTQFYPIPVSSVTMNQKNIARRVIYHGRVQGVGFRATTAHLARQYPVTGFVRNLTNGTVELQAQGSAEGVEGFLAKVATQFQASLTRVEEIPVTQEFLLTGFTIRE